MYDPQVKVLYYIAYSEREDIEYQNPPLVEWDAEQALYRIENGELTAWPKDHYASANEAHLAISSELKAWEAHVDLTHGYGELRFRYKDAELIDRNPPPTTSNAVVIEVPPVQVKATGYEASLIKGKNKYPEPPPFTRVDTDVVRDLLARYRQWQQGGEPFATMAYAILTRIIARAGSRKQAANHYNISDKVLKKLKKLVGEGQGDALEARKFLYDGTMPISNDDKAWMRKALSAIISQVAIVESGKTPVEITKESIEDR